MKLRKQVAYFFSKVLKMCNVITDSVQQQQRFNDRLTIGFAHVSARSCREECARYMRWATAFRISWLDVLFLSSNP
jgi:hypothetical protein